MSVDATVSIGGSCQSRLAKTTTTPHGPMMQDCDNGVALGLYQQRGYVCEMLDPPIRIKRRCYLRKRLSEESPESDVDMLAFEEGSPVFVLGEGGRGVAEESFLEKHFGVLAPSVAALGGVIGVIFF